MKLNTLGLIGLTVILLSGCRNEPTPESLKVRQIQTNGTTECRFLGTGSSSYELGFNLQDDISQTSIDLRNKVAAAGGNAYVKTSNVTTEAVTIMEYDIYKCRDGLMTL